MPDLLESIVVKGEDKPDARLDHLSLNHRLVLVLAIGADQVPAILCELVNTADRARQIGRRLVWRACAYDIEAAAYTHPEPVFHKLLRNIDIQLRIVDLRTRIKV